MPQHPSPNPSAPKPSTTAPTSPGPDLAVTTVGHGGSGGSLEPTPLSSRAEPLERYAMCKFVMTAVIGGHTVAEVENKERWPWSFEIDWARRVVWVTRELANGQKARAFVPFENIAWVSCVPRS